MIVLDILIFAGYGPLFRGPLHSILPPGILCMLCHFTHVQLLDCNQPGSSVHRILQARTLEWVAISFSSSFL